MGSGYFLRTFFLLVTLLMAVPGCSDRKAAELYETARFEELQNNKEHAIRLYERIIVVYPTSDYAVKAKERVDELGKK
jgi:TolA-binding protein